MVEKEEVKCGESIAVGAVTVVPIIRTVARCRKGGGSGVMGFGVKDVLGVVVLSPQGTRAINVSGEEVPVEDYAAQVPELARLLEER